jgi:hypothetical protein
MAEKVEFTGVVTDHVTAIGANERDLYLVVADETGTKYAVYNTNFAGIRFFLPGTRVSVKGKMKRVIGDFVDGGLMKESDMGATGAGPVALGKAVFGKIKKLE